MDGDLDLGRVGDIAQLSVDGTEIGVRMWAPYAFDLDAGLAGRSVTIEVRVTNSMANEYDGVKRPSGLMGPVELIAPEVRPT